ncbi:MAG: hydroxymethylbilane synthase [Polyangiaceae bacterium]|jgi:hydroxymethylbilane synthase|nr:hydroxymethylbilane synthase [Polyangiaceae bacterium]
MTKLTLATRKSQLALAQARAWCATLRAAHPGLEVDELHVVTTGDRITDRPLQEIGGKGLFLKEIEEALLAGEAHFAVHSIKDVPASLAPGLLLAAIPPREDPRDALVSRTGASLLDLPTGARVGTSSLRRATLLRRIRPDLLYTPLRGNVDTRLRKVREGDVDAAILALAGLKRLGLADQVTQILDPAESLPAVGQGALGIECRDGDTEVQALLRATHHPETAVAVACERGVLLAAEGSCQLPIAAYAERAGAQLRLRAMVADPDGSRPRFADEWHLWPTSEHEAQLLGLDLGRRLR